MKSWLLLICLTLCLSCGVPQGDAVSGKTAASPALKDDAATAPPATQMQESARGQKLSAGADTVITKHYLEIGGLWEREYKLTIRGTGEVTLRSKVGLHKLGRPERWKITGDDVARVVEAFDRANFFQLGNEYGKPFDNASGHDAVITVGFESGRRSKTVKRHLDDQPYSPDERALKELEQTIIKTAQAEPRIRSACYLQGDVLP
jgi:hypothetical protein